MKRILLITAFLVSGSFLAQASESDKTLQDRIPNYIKKRDNSFLTLTVENDLFGSGTDENYTSGVRLTYFDSKIEPSKIARKIGKLVPFFEITDTTNIYYSLGHNLYTPRDIKIANPNPQDRPYAGFLYGSIGYNKLTDNHVDDLEVTLGVVGPSALGEQIQKTVHEWINSPDPKGWDSQIKDEPAFMLAYQRMWPEAYNKEFDPFYFRVWPHAGATIGNVYTHANAGLTLQLVPSRHKWQALPSRVRPSIPGSGYFAVPEKQISWSAFAGIDARAVAHNIFLDGNTFKDSPSVDKKYGVLDASLGFTISYGRVQTAYTLNWRSKEFDNQEDESVFGSISIGYRF